MHNHPMARLMDLSRERLIRRHLEDGEALKDLKSQVGYSLSTAYKWLARFRTSAILYLVDRRSVRRSQWRTLDPHQLQQTMNLGHQRCTLRRIAKPLHAPLSIVGRVLNRLGLGRLNNLKPKKPVVRYQ
jgi:transposase